MSSVYTSPPRLRPVELWRLRMPDGSVAYCRFGPTTHTQTVVWYLNTLVQDAAGFEKREDAEQWAEDVRRMLMANSMCLWREYDEQR